VNLKQGENPVCIKKKKLAFFPEANPSERKIIKGSSRLKSKKSSNAQ